MRSKIDLRFGVVAKVYQNPSRFNFELRKKKEKEQE